MYMNEAQSVPVVPDASLYPHDALISDDQSLFDSNYEPFKPTKSQKVDSGSWGGNKRSLDSTDRDAPSPKRAFTAPTNEFLDRSSPAPVVPNGQDFDKRVIVPADPMCWTKEHVKQWIQWAIKEFSLRDIDVDCFDMTGKELCKLTREDFLKLAPAYNGDILMAHLCVLRRTPLPNLTSEDIDRALAPSVASSTSYAGSHYNSTAHYESRNLIAGSDSATYADRSSTSWPSMASGQNAERPASGSWSSQSQTNRLTHMKDSMAIVPSRSMSSSPQLQGAYPGNALATRPDSNAGSGQIQLWQFLLELLSDPKNSHFITWEGTNGEFKLIDPDEVARRWGERKNKPNMNYDKLSRALRYYYDKNIMSKIHGKRYAYKFDFHGLAQLNQPITSDAQAHAQAVYKFPGADFYPGFPGTSFYPGTASPGQYWSSQYWARTPTPQAQHMYGGPIRALPAPYYAA